MGSTIPSTLPSWVKYWLWLTALVCIWDATFILFRPHSLPGGKYHTFWKPYKLYIEVDTKYKDLTDPFVYAVSLLNLGEVILNFVALFMNYRKDRRTHLLTLIVCVMTFWKTFLYLLQYLPLCDGGEFFGNTNLYEKIFLFFIPNGTWFVVPLAIILNSWHHLSSFLIHSDKKHKSD